MPLPTGPNDDTIHFEVTSPVDPITRLRTLEIENEHLREALEFIARDYWTRDQGALALQEIARRALKR